MAVKSMLYAEVGVLDLRNIIDKRMMHFWLDIITGNTSKWVYQIYNINLLLLKLASK